jgi:hypothetical protein
MIKMKQTRLVALIGGVLLILYFWFDRGIDAQEANTIAQSAFKDLAIHLGKPLEDFVTPLPITDADKGDSVSLSWKSKSQPNCQIEVYVDRKYANARPIWNCF